jgi:hypothetical protein
MLTEIERTLYTLVALSTAFAAELQGAEGQFRRFKSLLNKLSQ